ncbi:capsular biosynthesis protein [Ruegeria sp. 2012CJ41-6]|uniref:Capsular biosynthesis protein n=1 Tax=Ruegeria spongiae TaxID=2942209 RepID=A0ABT0Q4L0_9RHOB|nr:capsular biosynthesis protein [Ruegeria spongiae]MCL6284745.1 capsular biosynthesis protein [Ruegeria spongiae]
MSNRADLRDTKTPQSQRVFLFLQGPHGPFFHGLARMLRTTGAETWRVGFNAGDRAFWRHSKRYIPYRGTIADWPDTLSALLDQHDVTDIVLYGDARPIHAGAIRIARARGVTVHVFEEGYLRPYWVTYERGGSNGNSRLMGMSVAQMQDDLDHADHDSPPPPAHWGDMREHIFYGALYHWFVMFRNRRYRNFQPHREFPVTVEFRLYLKRLLLMPTHAIERRIATRRVRSGGFPYHLALLQLEQDSSFQAHSPFARMAEFLDTLFSGFAEGAPSHHHLVIKAHPLENDRVPLRHEVRRLAKQHGIGDRVHYVRGGKLAQLLDDARSAVTVNSTSGQQVLWRGLPLKIFGTAVYAKPEFVSDQTLPAFFDAPTRPDKEAYRCYRRYLLETSQVPGGYYARKGRQQLLRQVVDMMLAPGDPYEMLKSGNAAPRQQLRLVN